MVALKQRRPHRPHRRLGRDGGRGRARLDAFRQRLRQRAGGAVRRRERRFSTAPFCVGVPTADGRRWCSTSPPRSVAEGKVLVARQGGKKLPAGRLISRDGELTADPHVLYGDTRARRARRRARQRRHPRLRRAQGLGPGADVRAAGRRAHRHGLRRTASGRGSPTACCRSTSTPAVRHRDAFPRDVHATSPGSSAPSRSTRRRRADPRRQGAQTRGQRAAEGLPLPEDTWASILGAAREAGVDERRIDTASPERMTGMDRSISSCSSSSTPSTRPRSAMRWRSSHPAPRLPASPARRSSAPSRDLPPIVGYAKTATIRSREPGRARPAPSARAAHRATTSTSPPSRSPRSSSSRTSTPEPGFGAFWGEVKSAVHKGLGCSGVRHQRLHPRHRRDGARVPGAGRLVGPSHACVRVETSASEVEVAGMAVREAT